MAFMFCAWQVWKELSSGRLWEIKLFFLCRNFHDCSELFVIERAQQIFINTVFAERFERMRFYVALIFCRLPPEQIIGSAAQQLAQVFELGKIDGGEQGAGEPVRFPMTVALFAKECCRIAESAKRGVMFYV